MLIFVTKYPVIFTHLTSLPNNRISFNYRVTVSLGLLKQFFFFCRHFETQLVLKLKGKGYFMKTMVKKLPNLTLYFQNASRKHQSNFHQPLLLLSRHKHHPVTNAHASVYDNPLVINGNFHF